MTLVEAPAPSAPAKRSAPAWPSIALAVAVGLGAVSFLQVDPGRVDDLGFLRALPVTWWLACAACIAAFAAVVGSPARRPRLAGRCTAVWFLLVQGVEPLTVTNPRSPVGWLHVGFGTLLDGTAGARRLDARFCWPGFFALPGSLLDHVQPEALGPLLRVWPLLVLGAWAGGVHALARWAFPTRWVAPHVAVWLFVLLSWTGQDYFSPQSLGLTLCLAGAVVVLREGRSRPDGAPSTRLARLVAGVGAVTGATAATPSPRPATTRAGVLLLALLAAGVTVSHPLSPFFLASWLAVLAWAGFRVSRGMAVVVLLGYLAWFGFVARPYWIGHGQQLVGGIGDVSDTVASNSVGRIADPSFGRQLVVLDRVALVGVFFASVLAAATWLRRHDPGRHHPTALLVALTAVPAATVALQSYGGELLIRVVLFALPFGCVLVAGALALQRSRRVQFRLVVVGSVVLLPMLVLARWGNEPFEVDSSADRAVLEAAYDASPEGTMFVVANPKVGWRFDRLLLPDGRPAHLSIDAVEDPLWLDVVRDVARSRDASAVTVMLTSTQEAWGEVALGYPDGWLLDFGDYLASQPGVEVLAEADGAIALTFDAEEP